MPPASPPYARELATAEAAARRAGAILQRFAESGVRYGFKASADRGREIVSEADLEADEAIQETLLGAFPSDGWLSEESADTDARLSRSRVWIVDPLDGTREFLAEVPEYAVSIALVVEGTPVLGVVFNPAKDHLVSAAVGTPPSGDGLNQAQRLEDTFVLAGHGEWRWRALPPLPEGTRVLPVGSVAYRMALLSTGTGGLIFTVHQRNEWDLAAGTALLLAAGACITDLDGRPLRFNKADPRAPGCIAGNATLHAEALAMWRRSGWSSR